MDFKELVKKYWFVGLVAIAMIVFVGIYAADDIKNQEVKVSSKQVDGKYVAFTVDGQDVYADDLYDTLFAANGLSIEYTALQRAVINESYETTDDMESIASSYATYILSYYSAEDIESDLASMGYINGVDDLKQYYIDAQKQEKMISEFLADNYDEYCADYVEENQPRALYHILIKVADVEEITDANGNTTHIAHPTEDEQKKLDDALAALETQDFATVASTYSDDSTASSGGSLGLITLSGMESYVAEFKEAALKLESGEVSDVVTTTYGYHIIYNAASNKEDLLANSEFVQSIEEQNSNIGVYAMKAKLDKLSYTIYDEDLKAAIDEIVGGGE